MNNAVTFAKQNNLQVGKELSAAQLANLTTDIVWMVEKDVLLPSGQITKALVPQVYVHKDKNTTDSQNQEGLISGNVVNLTVTGNLTNSGSIQSNTSTNLTADNVQNLGGTITGNRVSIKANTDINNIGGQIKGVDELSLNAGRNITIASTTSTQTNAQGSLTNINRVAGLSVTGEQGRLTMNAGQDINLAAANIENTGTDGTTNIIAGKNINLATVTESQNNKLVWDRDNRRTDSKTVDVGTTIQAAGSVNLQAGLDVNAKAATIESDKTVQIQAGRDINLTAGEMNQSVDEAHKHKGHGGGFATVTTTTQDTLDQTTHLGTTISGDRINLQAGQNLGVLGSSVAGTKDVNLQAKDNITIAAVQDNKTEKNMRQEKESGLLGNGFGFTIGTEMQKNTLDGVDTTQAKSTVGSVQGNVSIQAGKEVNIQASDVISGQNTQILGADVNITAGMETSQEKQSYEYSKSGLSVSLSSPAIDAIQNSKAKVDRAGEVSDKRLAALYEVQAAQDVKGLDKKIDNSINGIKSKDGKKVSPISLNVSIGSSSKTQNSTNEIVQAKGSQISAGENLDITATEGDVHVQGATLSGDNVHIQAVKDVTIESAENQTSNKTQNDGKSSGIGAQISASGIGFYAEASKNKELENGTILTHTPSEVTAKDTLKIEAGQDVNVLGSKASGNRVEVSAGKDLNLASQQDIDKYNEQSSSSGGKIGTAGIGLQANSSKGKIDSNYESVTTQAEIHAGQGGFAIEVGKNADLKGAVISSDATADKNKLSTDTLTYSDIQNKADYSANEKGFSAQGGAKKSVMPTVSMPISGDAGSTTKAAIANGSIEIRSNPKQDISQLNRDTGNSLNRLGKIFDKESIKEKQELTNLFGQEAYKAIGDVALKEYVKAKEEAAKYKEGSPEYKQAMERASAWDEGGSNKIWLHALAGGIMSSLSGNGFVAGASGAGLNEALQKELAKIKDPGLHELGSMVIGAAAAKLIRENAKTGMVTALNGTKYNWLDHEQQRAMYQELLAAGTDVNDPAVQARRSDIYSKYAALDLYNDANEPLKSWNNSIDPQLLDQMSVDMDVATDNGMTGNLAKGLSIYEAYGAYENAQAVRENLDNGTPIDSMAFKALNPDLAITPTREQYEEDRKEREKNESPGDYAYKYKNAPVERYYEDGTAAVHLEDGDHPAYGVPKREQVESDESNETGIVQERANESQATIRNGWDYAAGLGRGILGLPNLPGSDYSDKSNAFKYGYSVGNRAMPWALTVEGIKTTGLSGPEYAVGYNGTLAQSSVVDAWKVLNTGTNIMTASSNNSSENANAFSSNGADSEGSSKAGFKSQELLESHFEKHVGEFGNITKEQYLKGAQDLLNSKPGGDILIKIRTNGDTLVYNKATNEYAAITKDGIIRTYFKPTGGLDYFERQ